MARAAPLPLWQILPTPTGVLVRFSFLTGDLMGSTGELHIAKVIPALGKVLIVLVHDLIY